MQKIFPGDAYELGSVLSSLSYESSIPSLFAFPTTLAFALKCTGLFSIESITIPTSALDALVG